MKNNALTNRARCLNLLVMEWRLVIRDFERLSVMYKSISPPKELLKRQTRRRARLKILHSSILNWDQT